MFVPFIPASSKEENKVFYSDTVLPMKEVGENLRINSISHLLESSLEECLQVVFSSNPDVVFHVVQYSKENKTVYFYTNRDISLDAWKKKNEQVYSPLVSKIEVLEEVKNVLMSSNKDCQCVSLYDVLELTKETDKQFHQAKDHYFSEMNGILAKRGVNSWISSSDFDFEQETLDLRFYGGFDKFQSISFGKENGDLFVKKSDFYDVDKFLLELGDVISKLYDEYGVYRDFLEQSNYQVSTVNSNFLTNISHYGVKIYPPFRLSRSSGEFSLSAYSYSSDYDYRCNSHQVLSVLKGNEDEFLKHIFVSIEDCPTWSQPILFANRKRQLEEERKVERRKALVRKLFPFVKE